MITLEGSHKLLAVKFNFEATNNIVEYEACIAEMEALRELGVKEAEVFRDSTLVITQVQRLWKVKEEHLKPYQQYLEDLTKTFDKIEYTIIPRAQNQFVDTLATLASMVEIPKGVWIRPLEIEQSYGMVHKEKTEVSVLIIHANLNHMPPSELYSMTSSWPFSVWGIDVIGRIASKASNTS